MMAALLFWLLVLACCGVGARYGGRAGRWIAAIYILACAATLGALNVQSDWGRTHWPTVAVDVALLVGLVWVALGSRRYFPIWMAGLHLIAVASHFASAFVPDFAFKIYFVLQGFWAVPMLLSFAVGAMLDYRAGVSDEPLVPKGRRAQDPAGRPPA